MLPPIASSPVFRTLQWDLGKFAFLVLGSVLFGVVPFVCSFVCFHVGSISFVLDQKKKYAVMPLLSHKSSVF